MINLQGLVSELKMRAKSFGIFALFFIMIGAGVLYAYEYSDERHFSVEATYEELKLQPEAINEAIEEKLSDLVSEGGIVGAIDIVKLGLKRGDLFVNECHSLVHSIGHFAPGYYQNDFGALVEHVSDFCAGGYLHGAEAQIALEGGDFVSRLHELCDTVIEKFGQTKICFHGAGHAFLNMLLNTDEALAWCERLAVPGKYDSYYSKYACPEGVFSEVTNVIGGYDGETGRPYTGGPPMKIDAPPLLWCAKFKAEYQTPCALELNALGIGMETPPEEVSKILKRCITDAPNERITKACIYNVASSYARNELRKSGYVTFYDWMLGESDTHRLVYLIGTAQEVAQNVLGGQLIDTDSFCEKFQTEREVELCKLQMVTYGTIINVLDFGDSSIDDVAT